MGEIADKLTKLLVIFATLPVRLIKHSIRQKVIEPIICAVQIYDQAPMIAICGWEKGSLGTKLEKSMLQT